MFLVRLGKEFISISWENLWVIIFLIVIDTHSKWLEVVIMNDISEKSTISTLLFYALNDLCEEFLFGNGTQST